MTDGMMEEWGSWERKDGYRERDRERRGHKGEP